MIFCNPFCGCLSLINRFVHIALSPFYVVIVRIFLLIDLIWFQRSRDVLIGFKVVHLIINLSFIGFMDIGCIICTWLISLKISILIMSYWSIIRLFKSYLIILGINFIPILPIWFILSLEIHVNTITLYSLSLHLFITITHSTQQ